MTLTEALAAMRAAEAVLKAQEEAGRREVAAGTMTLSQHRGRLSHLQGRQKAASDAVFAAYVDQLMGVSS